MSLCTGQKATVKLRLHTISDIKKALKQKRRDDGYYSRLYLASVDDQGHFSKPFLLPQRHPKTYYEESVYSFNTPDFTKTKVDFDAYKAGREISSDKRVETKVK